MNYDQSNPELDSFREQWRAEVRARHAGAGDPQQQQQQRQQQSAAAGPSATTVGAPRGKPPGPTKPPAAQDHEEDYVQPQAFDEPAVAATTASSEDGGVQSEVPGRGEPVSALEHYEMAVEKEAAGNLGDSLRLYRKAFRVCFRRGLSCSPSRVSQC